MHRILTALFLILALIHLLPALSVFAPSKIASLYAVSPSDKAMLTLLQHRALFFAILCAGFVWAAFYPQYRGPVLIAGVISMAGFLIIAGQHGELAGGLRKIVVADIIGLAVAVLAAALMWKS